MSRMAFTGQIVEVYEIHLDVFEKLVCFYWTSNWFLAVVTYTFLFLVQFAKGDKQVNDILRDSSAAVPYMYIFLFCPFLDEPLLCGLHITDYICFSWELLTILLPYLFK